MESSLNPTVGKQKVPFLGARVLALLVSERPEDKAWAATSSGLVVLRGLPTVEVYVVGREGCGSCCGGVVAVSGYGRMLRAAAAGAADPTISIFGTGAVAAAAGVGTACISFSPRQAQSC